MNIAKPFTFHVLFPYHRQQALIALTQSSSSFTVISSFILSSFFLLNRRPYILFLSDLEEHT